MASSTLFLQDYGLWNIKTHDQYRTQTPVLHDEKITGYMDRVLRGR